MITILNALRAAPPKIGEVQPAGVDAARDAGYAGRGGRACSSARRRSGSSAAASALATCVVSFVSTAARSTRSSRLVSTTVAATTASDVNLPVPQAEQNNPETGNKDSCIDRNP